MFMPFVWRWGDERVLEYIVCVGVVVGVYISYIVYGVAAYSTYS